MSRFIEFENFETGTKVFVNVEKIVYIGQEDTNNCVSIYLSFTNDIRPLYVKGVYSEILKKIISE